MPKTTPLQQDMLQTLIALTDVVDQTYAPKIWKNSFSNWDLNQEFQKARREILSRKLNVKEYHQVLRAFFDSMEDYHVGVRLLSTERADLPFQVKGSRGRYFIVYIDRNLLPKTTFSFEVGDELISFNNQPTKKVVARLMKAIGPNTLETQHAIASRFLTRRLGRLLYEIPKGPVVLEIQRKGSQKTETFQTVWRYTKNTIDYSSVERLHSHSYNTEDTFLSQFENLLMIPSKFFSAFAEELSQSNTQNTNPHILGSPTSFLPPLGENILYKDVDTNAKNTKHIHNYIFEHKGRSIGYVRIPSYMGDSLVAKKIQKIINKFEKETDMLVINQVHNPGGLVFYLYALLSMLSDNALSTPLHRMSLTPQQVLSAQKILKKTRVNTK